jgi:DNA topoisomerase IA
MCLLKQWSVVADDVEVVKSVATDDLDKREETDQVALETVEQEQHIHPPPPNFVQSKFLKLFK